MSFGETLWNTITIFFWAFIFIAALCALVAIVRDLFRDRALNGWWKALWLVFLIFVPVLTSLVYLIFRGSGLAERSNDQARDSKALTDEYIRQAAGTSPADEIAKAKALLDAGTLTLDEFTRIKAHTLRTV